MSLSAFFNSTIHTTATAPAAGGVDKTRYLFYGTAAGAGNTASLWNDESGHGKHLIANPDAWDYGVGYSGKIGYTSHTGTGFTAPFSAVAPQITIYALMFYNTGGSAYFFSTPGSKLLLGINASDIGAYYDSSNVPTADPQPPVAAKSLVVWRLDAPTNTGRVYIDGRLVYTGHYTEQAVPVPDEARIGTFYNFSYAQFIGELFALVVRNGPESDDDMAAVSDALNAL